MVQAAVARAVKESFPHVRVFHSFDDRGFISWRVTGLLLPKLPFELAERMPARRLPTLSNGVRSTLAEGQFGSILRREISLDQMISGCARESAALQDDRPENEYFILVVNACPKAGFPG